MDANALYFVAGSALSIALSPVLPWIWHRLNRQISWRRFYAALRDPRALSAINGGKTPDVIIGVNSGIVPASILALNYFVRDLVFVHTMPEYDNVGNRVTPPGLTTIQSIAGKYVLIVDDQYYSGDTMRSVYNSVAALPGADTATIKRFAVFVYESPARQVHLDVRAPGRIRGVLATVPWVFTDALRKHYHDRSS